VGARSEAGNVDDAALAAAVATRDQAGLEKVFERYGGAVRSIALRVLRNEALAEDTVQEVFVAFWNAPDRFDPGRGSLRTFLLTLAHRRAVDIVRSEQARFNREEKVRDDVPPSIDEEVWSRTVSAEVREAVAALSEGEREAISLAYFGGLTYVEVAERLGLPEGTVKSRIRSGMRRLGTMLAEVAS
jgi:RNA polymerase sigma-70 factor (ECF subfamily)